MPVNRQAAMRAVADLLEALGYDPARDDELKQTPARVTDALTGELLSGRNVDLRALIERDAAHCLGEQTTPSVVVRDIDVATMCPHHLLPAYGSATVAYHPGQRMLGLGTLAKIVDACSRQLVLQERIGERVVEVLMTHGQAQGAYCSLSLWHSCLGIRGARQPRATVHTRALAGTLARPERLMELELGRGSAGDPNRCLG